MRQVIIIEQHTWHILHNFAHWDCTFAIWAVRLGFYFLQIHVKSAVANKTALPVAWWRFRDCVTRTVNIVIQITNVLYRPHSTYFDMETFIYCNGPLRTSLKIIQTAKFTPPVAETTEMKLYEITARVHFMTSLTKIRKYCKSVFMILAFIPSLTTLTKLKFVEK
jgi:hypothetical protein